MCRSIHPLHNHEPPATDEEIRAAAIQYVRKISGMVHPSRVYEAAFGDAVDAVTAASARLLEAPVAAGLPRDRPWGALQRDRSGSVQRPRGESPETVKRFV
jgi:hypothetical protein